MGKLGNLALAAAVGVAVLPACGGEQRPSGPSTADEVGSFTDGTRLKAAAYQIDGAPPVFLGWYDTALGVACSFSNETLLDRPVCFPSEVWRPEFAQVTYLFTDDHCGEQIVGTEHPGEGRYYVQRPDPGAGCSASARLFGLGDVVPPTGALSYRDPSSGVCRPGTATQTRYQELRLLGAEIPRESLVRGTLRHEFGRGRVVPLAIAGDDGSIQGALASGDNVVAWDNLRQEMVAVSALLVSGDLWFPAFMHQARYFLDAACTAPAAVGPACRFPATTASLQTIDACGRSVTTSLFDAGPRVTTPSSLYRANAAGDSCVPADEQPLGDPLPYATFSLGAAIPVAAFAEAVEVRTGTGQVQIVQAGSPGGPAMAALGLYDRVHGVPCWALQQEADDTLRCIPDAIDIDEAGFFADEACSVPLVLDQPENACAARPKFLSNDKYDETTGTWRRGLYPIGGRHVGMVYYGLPRGGECDAVGDAADVGVGEALLDIGDEIPTTDFAPVTLVRPN
jgi:hypothetical protein